MYADIIVDISSENIDRSYQYAVPGKLKELVKPGTPVVIPFGKGNRQIKGYVIGVSETPKIEADRIKSIISVPEKSNSIDEKLIELAWWIKEQFGSTMNDALHSVIPVSRKVKQIVRKTIILNITQDELKECISAAERRHFVAKVRFYGALLDNPTLDYRLVCSKLNITPGLIDKAETEGIIKIKAENTYRNPFTAETAGKSAPVSLNAEQKRVSDEIKADIEAGIRKDYLIHGVTGSGKTEVYLDVIDSVIKAGRQVIMLIPEIALTFQTVNRFYARFGDRISVFNSRMSDGERYDQYLRAKRGETDIVIGPRSALFTPFSNLGLIIIDEEHEGSYKSENPPRYETREVAFKRGEMENAPVILGSATPSLESYSAAKAGRLKLFELNERAGGAKLPGIHLVDMREELKRKNRSVFSRELTELMEDRLRKKEQIMLFLNRRGYTGFVSCRSCGHVIKCPHCDVSLTLHRDERMVCHYCGYSIPAVKQCPSCGSPYIGSFGIGTQKIEELLGKIFPSARVLRMDADSTRNKKSYEEILSSFANEEADILVGTQMIVKGHDFHKVTLVGILLADMSLFVSDFRSGEKTFQLLTQASGRAGRGELNGDVVIQTYNPGHYAVQKAAESDYKGFYEEEMSFRKLLKYPPAGCLMSIMCISKSEEKASAFSFMVDEFIKKSFNIKESGLKIIGPAPAGVSKINDYYRRVLIVKSTDYALLVRIKDLLCDKLAPDEREDLSLQFNFNHC